MLEVVTALAAFTGLCLCTKTLRLYGVIGIALLSLLFPVAMLAMLILGTAIYLYFSSTQPTKGENHVIRKLLARRD